MNEVTVTTQLVTGHMVQLNGWCSPDQSRVFELRGEEDPGEFPFVMATVTKEKDGKGRWRPALVKFERVGFSTYQASYFRGVVDLMFDIAEQVDREMQQQDVQEAATLIVSALKGDK